MYDIKSTKCFQNTGEYVGITIFRVYLLIYFGTSTDFGGRKDLQSKREKYCGEIKDSISERLSRLHGSESLEIAKFRQKVIYSVFTAPWRLTHAMKTLAVDWIAYKYSSYLAQIH